MIQSIGIRPLWRDYRITLERNLHVCEVLGCALEKLEDGLRKKI